MFSTSGFLLCCSLRPAHSARAHDALRRTRHTASINRSRTTRLRASSTHTHTHAVLLHGHPRASHIRIHAHTRHGPDAPDTTGVRPQDTSWPKPRLIWTTNASQTVGTRSCLYQTARPSLCAARQKELTDHQ